MVHPREHTRRPHQRRRTDAELRRDFERPVQETDARPVPTRMAEALIDLNAENPQGATRAALLGQGFSQVEIDTHFTDAEQRANRMFVRDVNEVRDDAEAPYLTRARMTVAIGELLPSRQFIVSELAGRGFTKAQMDAFLRSAIDDAGKAFSGVGTRQLAEVA